MKRKITLLAMILFPLFCGATNYYWVGGSGNWSDFSNHWATSSGGTIFHNQVPQSTDNVYFDLHSFTSGAQTVIIDQTIIQCNNMDWTGVNNNPTVTGALTNSLKIYGSLTLATGMNFNFLGEIDMEATTAGQTITTNGNTITSQRYNIAIAFNGIGGSWTLQDSLTTRGIITLNNGSLNTNNQKVTASAFYSNSYTSRALTTGASIFNFSGDYQIWDINPVGISLNAGTSTIIGTGNVYEQDFYGGGFTYNNISFTGPGMGKISDFNNTIHDVSFSSDGFTGSNNTFHDVSFGANANISGGCTFNNVTIAKNGSINHDNTFNNLSFSPGYTYSLAAGATQTINTSLTVNGNCGALISLVTSSTLGSLTTISKASGNVTISYVKLKDIHASGGATFIANNAIDLGNNTGWTINALPSKNLFWVGNGGNWDDGNHWSNTSGGVASGCSPSPVDNIFFDANSFSQAGQTITVNVPTAYCKNMTWTGVTNNPVLQGTSSSVFKIYGSLTLAAGMAFNFQGQIDMEATTTGQTITTHGTTININPNTSSIAFNGIGGGWILQDALTITGIIQFNNGSLSTNNQTVNIPAFISEVSTSRVLTLGSSVFNLSSANYMWDIYSSGITFDAGTSTINGTSTYYEQWFYGGGLTYNNIFFTGGATGKISDFNNTVHDVSFAGDGFIGGNSNTFHDVSFASNAGINGNSTYNDVTIAKDGFIGGNNSFNNLTFSPGYTYNLAAGATQTINASLTVNGNCGALIGLVKSSSLGSPTTISKASGNVTISFVKLKDINASGGATFTANNAIDLGNNTGWTINALPSKNLYWIGNSGNWDDGNHWSNASGGVPSGCSPTPVDNVFFDANSFSQTGQTVTVNVPIAYCNNITWTGVTNNPTIYGANTSSFEIYGSLTLATGMTYNFRGRINMQATTGGQTIITSGNIINNSGYYNGQLGIAFNGIGGGWTLQDAFNTTGIIQFSNGSLNTNNQTVTASAFFSETSASRTLTMGSSILNLSSENFMWDVYSSGITFDAGTSTINGTRNGSEQWFYGDGLTYNNVSFTGTTTGKIADQNNTFHDVSFVGDANINGNNTFHDVSFGANVNIGGSSTYNNVTIAKNGNLWDHNIFNNLSFSPGYTYTLGAGETQTILPGGNICAQGTGALPIRIQSTNVGVHAIISKASGSICWDYARVSDITATGGATFNAGLAPNNSQDMGGNSGLLFTGGCTPVSCTPCTSPSITAQPSNSTICAGSNASFAITATGTSLTYQWQVNPGTGFVNLSNTAPYSGVTTDTLKITAATVALNNYQYQCVIAGTCAPARISNSATLTVTNTLSVSASSTAILCNGGSSTVMVSASGGNAPYTGTGNFTVSEGTYDYTITDAHGCSAITSIMIPEPPELIAVSTSNVITCNSCTTVITVGANGGKAPYLGTGTFSGITPGTYSYTVTDANGCISKTTRQINPFSPNSNEISNSDALKNRIICGVTANYFKKLCRTMGSKVTVQTSPNSFPGYAIEHCGKFDIYYEDLINTNPQVGFSDPTAGVGAIRRNTLCAVLTYVQSVFDFSNIPSGAPIRLHIDQSFAPNANPAPSTTGYFAIAGPGSTNTGIPHIINGWVHDYTVAGTDPAPLNQYHSHLQTNFDQVFDQFGSPLPPINWHDNYQMQIQDCELDLYTVLLHEIGHTLGWVSFIDNINQQTGITSINGNNQFSGLDWGLKKGANQFPLTLNPLISGSISSPTFLPGATPALINNNDIWTSEANTNFSNNNASNVNNPVYSGELVSGWGFFAPRSVLSHIDDQLYLYSMRSRISPGDVGDYVMGPFGIKGILRRSYTDVEINTLIQIGYANNSNFNQSHITNLPPFSTKMAVSNIMNYNFPETVAADFPPLTNNGSSLVINLGNDPDLTDPENDPISVSPNSLVNIRGCGNGGNNHNSLALSNNNQTITYTPRANFYGRAQFGFKLFDGREEGSYVIYTIDVLRGTNVQCSAGNNIILNGNLEEGTEVKQLGTNELIQASQSEQDQHREGKMRTGIHFADCQPYCFTSFNVSPYGSGEIVENSQINCNGSIYRSSAGSYQTTFPGGQFNDPNPNAFNNVGERYKNLQGNYNYFNLCDDMQNCKRYILEFDYFAKPWWIQQGQIPSSFPLTVAFTNSPTTPFLTPTNLTFNFVYTLNVINNNSWNHITIPFTYCGTTPASILNLQNSIGDGFLTDNFNLHEDLNPPPPLTVTVSPSNASICAGSNVTLISSVSNVLCTATYLWAPGGQTTAAITVTPNTATTYSLTVNDGCRSTNVSTTVNILSPPTVVATPSSQTLCSGGITSIGLSSSTSGTTFTWTIITQTGVSGASNGSGPSIQQTLTATGTNPGTVTYNITPKGPSPSFCVGVAVTVTITVNPKPVVTASSQTICSGGLTSMTLTSNVTGTTFTWTVVQTGVSGASSCSSNCGNNIAQTLFNLGTTPGTATYTITPSANGCPGSPISRNVTVNPPPTLITSLPTICPGDNINLATYVSPAGGVFSGANTTSSGLFNASAGGTYSVTYTLSGCLSSTTINVVVSSNCCISTSNVTVSSAGANSSSFGTSFSGYTSGKIAINGNLTINNNFTINQRFLMFAPNVKIIIQNLAQLTINSSTLYTCGSLMWDGIEIQPGGMLIITNSLIEDAKIAVSSENTGKIANFRIENNTTFNRNYIGVKVFNYTLGNQHPGIIRNCTFDSHASTISGNGGVTLDAPYNTQTAEYGIELNNVNYIQIGDASGANYKNNFWYLRTGIRAQNSTYNVFNNEFKNNFHTPYCIGQHGGPPCPTIGWAIWNTNTSGYVGGYLNNQSNNFQNLSNGILQENGSFLIVQNNTFKNIVPNISPSSFVSVAISANGFVSGGFGGLVVQDNTFNLLQTGISYTNNYNVALNVYGNTFTDFSVNAIDARQNRFGYIYIDQGGHNNLKNKFSQSNSYNSGLAILIGNAGLPLTSSPFATNINNNIINNVNNGISITSINAPQVKYNNIDFKNSPNHIGIRVLNCKSEFLYNNIISKANPVPSSVLENSVIGISVETSVGFANISQNSVTRLGTGLRFRGYNTANNPVTCNVMTDNWSGLTLDAVNIGNQGQPATSSPAFSGISNDNQWSTIPNNMTGSFSVEGKNSWTPVKFYTRSAGLPWCPPGNKINPPVAIFTSSNTPSQAPVLGPQSCSNICYPCHHAVLAKIARNQSPFNAVIGTARFTLQEAVLRSVLSDSLPPDITTTDGHDLQAFIDTTLTTTNVGKLVTVSTKYEAGDLAGAIALNNSIVPVGCAEEYHQTVNTIFFNTWGIGIFYFPPVDSTTLYNIAIQDPLLCGTAIYDARVMLGIDINDYSAGGSRMMEIPEEEGVVADKVGILYPNPAQDKCTYEASLAETESGMIMMYTLTGKLISSYRLNSGDNKIDIDLASLSNGIYLYKIYINGEVVDYKKLVISK